MMDQADCDLASGIGRALSNVAEKILDTGGNVFDIFARGSLDVANATTNTISGIGHSISRIFDWSGGTSNFILFMVNGAIILYLVIKHRMDNQTKIKHTNRLEKEKLW